MLRNQIRAFSMLVLGENQFSEWEIHIIEVSHEVRNRFSIGDFLLNDPAVIEHRRVIAATNRVPWGMAIATGRRCAGSLVGRSLGYVFSHFFDLGAIGVDLKRHFNFSASGRFLGVLGVFGCIGSRLGCFGNGVIVLICWVDICWVVVCFGDFVLGVLRTWNMRMGRFGVL